ncbi:hypothetical protein [Halobacteriaceae bacterium SHR40]|uniref:hypothetical protein n=1 Tax=Halovenus amylolytica TaxID=2500550 RepID=UPI000FE3539C
MTRDADRCPDLDPDRDPNLEVDPDRACARDWQPVDAPERRPEPKCEDEPVQRSPDAADDASGPGPDPAARVHDTHECDHAARRAGGDGEPDVGARHG